jgi:hypothetical protein
MASNRPPRIIDKEASKTNTTVPGNHHAVLWFGSTSNMLELGPTLTVTLLLPVPVKSTLVGETVQESPVGAPLHAKATLPLKLASVSVKLKENCAD